MEEEIEEKNKEIVRIKTERDAIHRKYVLLENEKKAYQEKTREQIKKSLLELYKIKREEQVCINPSYGYFNY